MIVDLMLVMKVLVMEMVPSPGGAAQVRYQCSGGCGLS